MRVMRLPLAILTIAGCWQPDSYSSALCKRTLYGLYTIFVSLMLFTFMVPQFMDIIINVDNPDDFTDTFYVTLATFLAFCKMLTLLLNRKNIKMLTDMLAEKPPFRPIELDEIEVRQKFDRVIENNTIYYTTLVETTCVCMSLTSLFTDFRKGDLTYREWTPYDYSDDLLYYLIFFRQMIGITAASVVNVACDSIICGLLLHICCQMEILTCRLKRCLRGQGDFDECVRHHDRIYKFAYMINEKFRVIIAVQFAVSTLVVCSNMYRLAKTSLSAKYIPLMLYTSCMLTQILIYCWFGNEVKLKSVQLADEIFGMDWLSMKNGRKKGLVMIMNRCLLPIEFSSAYILTMNLESFGKLLKMSYSIYNVLQLM